MMTIQQIYDKAIEMGIKADPRGEAGVKRVLAKRKEAYEEMHKAKKAEYDLEDLKNPYSDSRILIGDLATKVDKVMAGIDISSGEVVLADRLNQKGEGIDLLIAHHPVGGPLAALHEVMELQADHLARYGVPITIAEGVMRERIGEVQRVFSPRNHNQAVDAARLLGFAVMCTHTITDNLVNSFLEKLFEKKSPETVGDVLTVLKGVSEYKEAMKGKAGPVIFAGNEKYRAGKICVDMTGGTEASSLIYEKLALAGVGTIVGMHAAESHRKECLKHHINLVIAGHMSSDSLGMNIFLDEIEKHGVKILPCSGFIRIKRVT